MLKTLLLSENFPPRTGGSGRWFWELYRRLPRQRVVIAAGEHASQEAFDQSHDLHVVRLPLTLRAWGLRSLEGLRGYHRALVPLWRLVGRERVEMIHCGRCLPEGVLAWMLRWLTGVPYACYVHGEDVTVATTSRELRWLAGRVLDGARFLIANSEHTASLLRRDWNLPAERVRLLHPGVDADRFEPAAPDAEVRTRLGWGERLVVLTVGRLQKRKGHDQMIRAVGTLRRSFPDLLYAIVGDGEERAFLQELAVREGVAEQVQFLGEMGDDDLVHCYQQCDLFVLPNRQVGADIEGFGMVLLEAQACGKPVVAGASGGTAETMRIPETGRVVPCDTPDELIAVVGELLGDAPLRARMGEAAREWVVEHFDWKALCRQAEALFGGAPAVERLPEAVGVEHP